MWAPWLVVAGLVLLHNVARFGRAGEFGVTYVLSSWPTRTATNLALRFVPVNLVAYLVAPPHVDPQFPFVHLVPMGLPPRPPGYATVEAVAGILWCVRALVLLPGMTLLARRRCPAARAMTAALVAQAAAMLALLACFRWAAARYLVDALPFLAVATAIGWCPPSPYVGVGANWFGPRRLLRAVQRTDCRHPPASARARPLTGNGPPAGTPAW